jgi:alpha-D-xyloside xylohydrolase
MVWGRSAYAGSQRYPLYWSGDNGSSFGSMRCSLRGGLDLGLSGFSFWSQDTGGFVGEPTDELYIRWTQLSVFQSHFRYHGCYPFREPWQFGAKAQKIVRRYLELRYRLIPYLYSESIACAEKGLPLLRHLVVDYQSDPTVYSIDDQFLCGDQILVAPIMSKENERCIYLPHGEWYDLFTFEHFHGGQWINRTSSIEEIPVFVRAGSILPMGPVTQSTVDIPNNPEFDLLIFLDQNGQAAHQHRNGKESINITAKEENQRVSIQTSGSIRIASSKAFNQNGVISEA